MGVDKPTYVGHATGHQAGVTSDYTGPSEPVTTNALLMTNNTDTGRYLYIVTYDEDAERKRVEYLFNNWDEGTIERPAGLTRVAEGVSHDDLYEQLVGKVPEDQVSVYQLEDVETDVEPEQTVVNEQIMASRDAVEAFLEYILSKKKAVLQSAGHNEYEIYVKKGRTTVSYSIAEEQGGLRTVRVTITGYPPAPSFLADFFETELAEYAASQSTDQS